MVRTSGGAIRISSGKSSKKSGGGASGGGGGNVSTPSTPSGSKDNSRLPPIPHCEVPSWQKPITNFFNLEAAGTSKDLGLTAIEDKEKPESSGATPIGTIEDKNNNDEELAVKGSKKEESDKENLDGNVDSA